WNYSKEVSKMRLSCEGLVKDTPGLQLTGKAATGENEGLKERAKPFAKSTVVRLTGRPHLDFFNSDKLIPPNTEIRLRFTPSTSAFCLIADTDTAYEMTIIDFKFIVRQKTINPQMLAGLQLAHREQNYEFNYTKVQMKQH